MMRSKKAWFFRCQWNLKKNTTRRPNEEIVLFSLLNNQRGFLLISVIFIMILMAVSIFSINYYSITQIRMASNRAASVQTAYDLNAIVEESVWKLTDNLFWRTVEAGEDASFNGTIYTRIARDANLAPFNYPSDYDDAVTIQVIPKGASQSLQRSFRYYAKGFAGTGVSGSSGDGGSATSARLNHPRGLFVDSSGNLYIADTDNHNIRKVDTSGIITTVAGKNSAGWDGDNKTATSAKLWEPNGIFVDSSGNFYIADTLNHRIRKVNTSKIITTVVGTGIAGSSGDGGFATSATLDQPRGVFLDSSNNIYIADTDNHNIRKVDTSGIITTVAGTGSDSGVLGDGGPATGAKLLTPLVHVGINMMTYFYCYN